MFPNRKSGFTLLEILVSVGILAIIITATYTTFFLINRAESTVSCSSQKLLEMRRFLDMLSYELASTSFASVKIKEQNIHEKSVSRISFRSFAFNMPGMADIAYFALKTNGRLDLYKTIKLVNERHERVVMLEHIEEFTVKSDRERLIKVTISSMVNKSRLSLSRTIEPMKERNF